MAAARSGNLRILDMLLRARAKVNEKDYLGRTALKIAADAGDAEFYRRLKKAGASGDEPITPQGTGGAVP